MKQPMNRRMFLRGAGGTVMAVPFLPSLTSRAFAADPVSPKPGKCFVGICTDHGEIWGKNMYPNHRVFLEGGLVDRVFNVFCSNSNLTPSGIFQNSKDESL